jgi:hypothetical protein
MTETVKPTWTSPTHMIQVSTVRCLESPMLHEALGLTHEVVGRPKVQMATNLIVRPCGDVESLKLLDGLHEISRPWPSWPRPSAQSYWPARWRRPSSGAALITP